jgi:cation diffusion facilitator CzcD-associated flavoprotein CzcO
MSYNSYPLPERVSPALREKYGTESPYRDRELIREWIEDIFVRNGYGKLVKLNTTVEKAEKKDGKWVLTLRTEEPGKNWWWQESFDAIVVASGHYNLPWFPKIPGLLAYESRFPGRILHSKHFRDPKKFKGKVSQKNLGIKERWLIL